ncbi:MAG: hypothetical protein J0M24_10810 [Verrucomicrobia bacterium]|nr:hypothetical protein [Verrucomicrobiota bacterium]
MKNPNSQELQVAVFLGGLCWRTIDAFSEAPEGVRNALRPIRAALDDSLKDIDVELFEAAPGEAFNPATMRPMLHMPAPKAVTKTLSPGFRRSTTGEVLSQALIA